MYIYGKKGNANLGNGHRILRQEIGFTYLLSEFEKKNDSSLAVEDEWIEHSC
jgi:hypothetical protein